MTVILEVPKDPGLMLRLVGLAVKPKSAVVIVTPTVVVWLAELPVPVTVIVPLAAPVVAVSVRVDVADVVPEGIDTVAGLKVAVTPEGRFEAVRLTDPVNPSLAVIVMVEVAPWPPMGTFTLVGDAETKKSGLVTVIVNVVV